MIDFDTMFYIIFLFIGIYVLYMIYKVFLCPCEGCIMHPVTNTTVKYDEKADGGKNKDKVD